MAREWVDPASGAQILEDGEKEYVHPAACAQIQEDQAAADTLYPVGQTHIAIDTEMVGY